MKKTWMLVLPFALLSISWYYSSLHRSSDNQGLSVLGQSETEKVSVLLQAAERSIQNSQTEVLEGLVDLSEPKNSHVGMVLQNPMSFTLRVGNITINGSSAIAICDLVDFKGLEVRAAEIQLKKISGNWRIAEGGKLVEIISGLIANSSKVSPTIGGSDALNAVSVATSPMILVSVKHPGTNAFLINRNLADQALDRYLFSTNTILSMDAILPLQPGPGYEIGFMVDRYWNRIIFGKQDPNSRWISSYGDNLGDYHFSGPQAIAIDPFDTIFVADTYHKKIVKLFFNRTYNTINFVSALSAPEGVVFPSDISFDQADGLPCSPSDDGLWISDEPFGAVVKVNRRFEVEKTITHYTYGSTTYRLQHPRAVAVFQFGGPGMLRPYIAVIDKDRNALVTLDARVVTNGIAPALRSVEFDPAFSELTCLGNDWFGQFWVGDKSGRMYHVFSDYGDYLASIERDVSETPLFASPSSISRMQQRFSGECTSVFGRLNIVTADLWGPTTGLRNFLPGADAVNVSATRDGDDFIFKYTPTNVETLWVEIVNESNQVVHSMYNASLTYPYPYEVSRPASILPIGNLKFRVRTVPKFNNLYSEIGYAQPQLVREVSFVNEAPPPTDLVATSFPGNIHLTWTPIPNAPNYRVFRDGIPIGTTATPPYWDDERNPGQQHSYTVGAFSGSYDGPVSSPVSSQGMHLQTGSGVALASNSQRKVVGLNAGGAFPTEYFATYESGGEIFVTRSSDGGATWALESRVSEGLSWGAFSAPSIAAWTSSDRTFTDIYVVYREQVSAHWELWLRAGRRYNPPTVFNWQTVHLNDDPLPLSVDTRPVVARSVLGSDGRLVVLWNSDQEITMRLLWGDPSSGEWTLGSSFTTQGNGLEMPAISATTIGEGDPSLYLSYDDGKDVYLGLDGVFGGGYDVLMPASINPKCFSSQIAADGSQPDMVHHFAHVVWEAIQPVGPPPPSTDSGEKWEIDGQSGEEHHTVMYEQYSNYEFHSAHEFVNSQGDFFRPTIEYDAAGIVWMAWDDGQNSYKGQYDGSTWSVSSCPSVNPQLSMHGSNGPQSSPRVIAMSSSGPPFEIRVGADACNEEINEDYGREVIASSQPDTTGSRLLRDSISSFSVRIERAHLKLRDGSLVPLGFPRVSDSLSALNELNAWESLITVPVRLPVLVDSVILDGSVSLRSAGRLFGTGERFFRFGIDAVDMQGGEIIGRIGTERVLQRDTTVRVRIGERLAGLENRRLAFKPVVNWSGRGKRRLSYTLVHIHTLYTDSIGFSSPLAAQSGSREDLPTEFALHQNYPNPFNPATRINFDLPDQAHVSLVVYDVLGRTVIELVDGHMEGGYHNVSWNTSGEASGVYFARFTATSAEGKPVYSKVNKLVLMK